VKLSTPIDSTAVNTVLSSAEGPETGEWAELRDVDGTSDDTLAATAAACVVAGRVDASLAPGMAARLAEALLMRRWARSASDVWGVVRGLTALNGLSSGRPLAVRVVSRVASQVQVSVTDVFGASVAGTLTLTEAVAEVDDETRASGVDFQSSGKTSSSHALDFAGAVGGRPGFYLAELAFVPKDAKTYGSVKGAVRDLKVSGALTVSGCTFVVSDSSDADDTAGVVATHKCTAGKTLAQTVSGDATRHVHLRLNVAWKETSEPMRPHQAILRIAPDGDKVAPDAWSAAVGKPGPDSSLVFHLDLKRVSEDCHDAPGKYTARVTLGDAAAESALEWSLAHLSLDFDGETGAAEVTVDPYAPRPAIAHTFRTPEPRPATVVSLAFTGLTLVPLLVLLVGLGRVGVNFAGLPSGGGSLVVMCFHASVGAIFLLYVAYWLKLNMFQTLKILGAIAPVVFFTGRAALSQHAAMAAADKSKTE
jgi:oligosaccharyltransferase complex subunit delta (ribophorin II)